MHVSIHGCKPIQAILSDSIGTSQFRIGAATLVKKHSPRPLLPLNSTPEDPEISSTAVTAAIVIGPAIPREPLLRRSLSDRAMQLDST